MFSLRAVTFASALAITMGVAGLSPATAGTETWDFLNPTGQLGNNQNYFSSPSGLLLIASGFQFGTSSNIGASVGFTIDFSNQTTLFGKNLGGNENGLGI